MASQPTRSTLWYHGASPMIFNIQICPLRHREIPRHAIDIMIFNSLFTKTKTKQKYSHFSIKKNVARNCFAQTHRGSVALLWRAQISLKVSGFSLEISKYLNLSYCSTTFLHFLDSKLRMKFLERILCLLHHALLGALLGHSQCRFALFISHNLPHARPNNYHLYTTFP